MTDLDLNEFQRRAVGVRVRAVGEAVQTLRRAGLDVGPLDEIEQLLRELSAAAGILPPPAQRSLVATMIAEILIDAAEIRPIGLRRYGALDEQTARGLEVLSARLTDLANRLEAAA